ncbi:MAG: tRNA lysidine(34) synthetase TilS [Acidobacteriota bacterium]|nr:tRNA lysidine(34) synthetase TilS [Acidobacteriota bacterium]
MILTDIARDTLTRRKLFRPRDKVLVACSGGADSMALLHMLWEMRKEFGIRLEVGHFNHGLRVSAGEDECFVDETCARLDLPFISEKGNVRAFAAARKMNLEEAARDLRYAFLRETALKMGANRIATGHTLNDQAETYLMRLLRGSGMSGLGGIAVSTEEGIVRPLIEAERRHVLEYLKKRRIPFREDESNRDKRILRNRIRLELLPYLEKRYGPGLVSRIGRLAIILQEEDRVMTELSREMLACVTSRPANRRKAIDAKALEELEPALAARVVREFLRDIRGDLRGLDSGHITSVLKLTECGASVLPGGFEIRRRKGKIYSQETGAEPGDFEIEWDGAGELVLPNGLRFRGKRMSRKAADAVPFDDRSRAFVDADRIEFPLLVRNRRPGDRYRPLGAPGSKKLKEILRAKGVEVEDRDILPVFLSGGSIVWVPGLPVAEAFRLRPSTRSVFLLG